jgi:hypothetical protein
MTVLGLQAGRRRIPLDRCWVWIVVDAMGSLQTGQFTRRVARMEVLQSGQEVTVISVGQRCPLRQVL